MKDKASSLIISKTPLRVSFVGGGTDIPCYYRRKRGIVISTTIDKYIYVIIRKSFDGKFTLKHLENEVVDTEHEIKHPIIREAIKMLDIKNGIKLAILSDLPGKSGLGFSSSLTVGLLNALHLFKEGIIAPSVLARQACEIEINRLSNPVGKQDQYIAAYGGMNIINFNCDDSVDISPLACSYDMAVKLSQHLMLFYTGINRNAKDVLEDQIARMPFREEEMEQMVKLVEEMKSVMVENKDVRIIGEILDQAWKIKKTLSNKISNEVVDDWHCKAINAGAIGGKLLGAGGGGFLLFFVEERFRDSVLNALLGLQHVPFQFTQNGSVAFEI